MLSLRSTMSSRALARSSRFGTSLHPAEQARILRLPIERIDVAPDGDLSNAARRRDPQPRRRACGPGGSRPGHVRSLTGGRRVVAGRVGLEVDTLTIRIPMRLQRRGGGKLIMTREGVAASARKASG